MQALRSNIKGLLKGKHIYLQGKKLLLIIVDIHHFSALQLSCISLTPLGFSQSPGQAEPPTENGSHKAPGLGTGVLPVSCSQPTATPHQNHLLHWGRGGGRDIQPTKSDFLEERGTGKSQRTLELAHTNYTDVTARI